MSDRDVSTVKPPLRKWARMSSVSSIGENDGEYDGENDGEYDGENASQGPHGSSIAATEPNEAKARNPTPTLKRASTMPYYATGPDGSVVTLAPIGHSLDAGMAKQWYGPYLGESVEFVSVSAIVSRNESSSNSDDATSFGIMQSSLGSGESSSSGSSRYKILRGAFPKFFGKMFKSKNRRSSESG